MATAHGGIEHFDAQDRPRISAVARGFHQCGQGLAHQIPHELVGRVVGAAGATPKAGAQEKPANGEMFDYIAVGSAYRSRRHDGLQPAMPLSYHRRGCDVRLQIQ